MKTVRIEFTPAQASAVLHRLECFDCFEQVFSDSDDLEHLAAGSESRAQALCTMLETHGYVDAKLDEMDKEILIESIAGSTYVAVVSSEWDDVVPLQRIAAAKRALRGAAQLIEQAYGLESGSIDVPEA